ncbi:MAG: precorrin-2 C(20)-methyltransferase [Lachnospiraceae bacterium]|nr:precorrin-2 C(20)-methyltransferase [Lachnospiraceae bacterium]
MSGILYGVGVGPGDPELMTLKAVRLIRENDVIALPGKEPAETTAYKIAEGAVPEIREKELLAIYMPMVHDKEEQKRCHREGARQIESCLDEGKNVVFLTLGDVTVYSTFTYIQQIVEADGYQCELVNGIPSFCAAAATLGTSLGLWNEQIHIYPAVHHLEGELSEEGTVILMKSGSHMSEVKEQLKRSGRDAMMVENCGMKDEVVYHHVDEIPDEAGYYSLIIAKQDAQNG